MILEWALICFCIGIIIYKITKKEEEPITLQKVKIKQPKKIKHNNVEIEDMILYDSNNDDDIYDIGRINL